MGILPAEDETTIGFPVPEARVSPVLIVEDDPAHAEAIGRSLEGVHGGRPVRYARSLAEARLAIEKEPPAIVLADLNLGDGSALELLPGPGLAVPFPLLVLTSHGDEHSAVESMRSGAVDYVVKSKEAFASLPRALDRALREWQLMEQRRHAEHALRDSEERFRVLFSVAPDAMLIHDSDGWIIDGNRAAEDLVRLRRDEIIGKNVLSLGIFSEPGPSAAKQTVAELLRRLAMGHDELSARRPDGSVVDIEVRTVPLTLQGRNVVLVIARDISVRRQAERTRRRLEEQLQHAMKLDAIGRLAGGVAHDFNNLLTVISGYVELLLAEVRPSDPMHGDLMEIKRAGQRATSLTAQLLAFGRKQVILPTVVDLNELLSTSVRMIQRLIGEHVQLSFVPDSNIMAIRVDPAQMDQVLINLAVNARDAMPDGGVLSFETSQVVIDEVFCAVHLDARPGPHARLRVKDTGSGMPQEVVERLFEPFFTTKPKGEGTGLGLSIIYGIIKQNEGFILVTSELGIGTTFDIFMPSTMESVSLRRATLSEPPVGRSETILLVEDDHAVLKVTERFLRGQGYRVVATDHAASAEALFADRLGKIDLLLSDVVMPSVNGRQLWERLKALRPDLRAIFMSGHTDDVIARQGILEPGMRYLQKPFLLEDLAKKVRDALDE
jgi:PAS domain S-box-containing protein